MVIKIRWFLGDRSTAGLRVKVDRLFAIPSRSRRAKHGGGFEQCARTWSSRGSGGDSKLVERLWGTTSRPARPRKMKGRPARTWATSLTRAHPCASALVVSDS